MKKAVLILALGLSLSTLGAQSQYAVNVEASILVKEGSADAISSWVESNGGYWTLKSKASLVLRLPPQLLPDFERQLETLAGRLLSFNISSRDLSRQLRETQAAIASREEILAQNDQYLEQADIGGTLTLEKEISEILSEIEWYKGQLNYLQNQVAMSEIWISLQAPQPLSIGRGGSNFPWLENLDFYRFMERTR